MNGNEQISFAARNILGITKAPKTQWAVDGLIPAGRQTVIFGQSNCGKSFIGLSIALSVATGQPFFGRRVRQGTVVYVAGEGEDTLLPRTVAWKNFHSQVKVAESNLLCLSSETISLMKAETAYAIKLWSMREIEEKGLPTVGLFVWDTWARCFGGDENSNSDTAQGLKTLDLLKKSFPDAATIIVHHTGKGDKKQARGASGLRCGVDCEYRAELRGSRELAKGKLLFECTKMRGAYPPALEFSAQEVEIETDDGGTDTSLVLTSAREIEPLTDEPNDDEAAATTDRRPSGKNQIVLWEEVKRRQENDEVTTKTQLKKLLMKDGVMSERVFYFAFNTLIDEGFLVETGDGLVVEKD
ncbi:MAG: helicase RepA family protein [Planctomycetota bacterium]|jgi:hypothetical protein|nr:helicase RepA family protein [Planctomycetota bacterium]